MSNSHENTLLTMFKKLLLKGQRPFDNLWPHICWCLMCDSTQGSLCPTPMVIHQSIWIQWIFVKNLAKRSMTPLLLRSYVWLYPRIIVSKSHENMSKYVDTVTLSCKNLNKRSLTPRWHFDPKSVKVTWVILPKVHSVQVPWKYTKVCGCGYSDP